MQNIFIGGTELPQDHQVLNKVSVSTCKYIISYINLLFLCLVWSCFIEVVYNTVGFNNGNLAGSLSESNRNSTQEQPKETVKSLEIQVSDLPKHIQEKNAREEAFKQEFLVNIM